LRGAQISTNVVAGGTQGPATYDNLVPASTSSENIASAAASINSLNTVYGSVSSTGGSSSTPSKPSNPPSAPTATPVTDGISFLSLGDIFHPIEVGAGDHFHWLKSGVEHTIQIVKHAASDAWHFVATITGQVYHAALSTVEAVVGAVERVF
jgi:hypothetical protein